MFDGIEVRRIGRQEQQVAAGGLDQAQRGWGLVEPGIVQDDHAGWRQHRQQNVLEIEVHDLARAVAVKDERRDQLLALAGGDDTGSVPSRTGHLLFNPCTPRCTGVFPIQAMIHAAFIQIKDGHVSQIFEFAAEQPVRISRESYQGIQHNLPGKTVKVTSENAITYQANLAGKFERIRWSD